MNISLILSGGAGARFGGETPKQYRELLGKEIISYTVEAMKKSAMTNKIIIIADKDSTDRLSETYGVMCVQGGSSRNGSLRRGLDYIKTNFQDCEKVFINEAARPFLTPELVDLYFDYLDEYDAVITAKRITDSLGREGEAVTLRDEYYLIQAPEAFRFTLLEKHFRAGSPITATVQQLPAERNVMRYFGYSRNYKITYPEDLIVAEQMMSMEYNVKEY